MKYYIVPVTAIAAIAVLLLFAIDHGLDGLLLVGGISTIAGIAGYKISSLKQKLKG